MNLLLGTRPKLLNGYFLLREYPPAPYPSKIPVFGRFFPEPEILNSDFSDTVDKLKEKNLNHDIEG